MRLPPSASYGRMTLSPLSGGGDGKLCTAVKKAVMIKRVCWQSMATVVTILQGCAMFRIKRSANGCKKVQEKIWKAMKDMTLIGFAVMDMAASL